MLPVLYSFRRCPYAIRARLALRVAGIAVELREVDLGNKPAAMLALSPKGTVPVLHLIDGSVLDESLTIMRWALAQHDPDNWLREHAASLELIARNDTVFKPLLDRYKYNAANTPERLGARTVAMHEFIAPLEQTLIASRWLLGTSVALADMAIMPFVRQFAGVDAGWFADAFPAMQGWLASLTRSALFDSVMVKHSVWLPGS
jgi:glutathione S-transferase